MSFAFPSTAPQGGIQSAFNAERREKIVSNTGVSLICAPKKGVLFSQKIH